MSLRDRVRSRRHRVESHQHAHLSGESTADWRKVADRGLEIVICVGHIFGVIMLIAEHLL